MINILIVSPDPLHCETIKLVLQAPQIEILCIDHSKCLLEECGRRRVAMIIFLSLSPYFTSMNIVEQLKNNLDDAMPLIFVVAHSHAKSTILTLLECGVSQYLTFPLNLYRLRSKVHSVLLDN